MKQYLITNTNPNYHGMICWGNPAKTTTTNRKGESYIPPECNGWIDLAGDDGHREALCIFETREAAEAELERAKAHPDTISAGIMVQEVEE